MRVSRFLILLSIAIAIGLSSQSNARGPAEEDESFDLIFSLKLRNQQELDQLIAEQHDPNSPSYQKWLTPEQFGERFGASREDYERVENWLKEQGFEISVRWPSRAQINFRATAKQIKQAFRTSIKYYRNSGELFFANETEPVLPDSLTPLVDHISGLENFSQARPILNFQKGQISPQFRSGNTTALAPKDLQRVYNLESLISSGIDGRGQKIGIVARSNFKKKDINLFRSQFGLPPGNFKKVQPFGTIINRGGKEELEVVFDTEWAGAAAPAAQIFVVIAADIFPSLQYLVNKMSDVKIISVSFRNCEPNIGERESRMFHNLYTQAAAQGQTVFVAAGNEGANDCGDGKGRQVNGLASSPNCVAVGGLTLDVNFDDQGNATSLGSETAWQEGGGGSSTFYEQPEYQKGVPGVPQDNRRSMPDVAQLADQQGPGAFIGYQKIITCCIGGTSLATPIWASFLALVNQKAGPQGNFNFKIYSMGAAQFSGSLPSVFNDTIKGNNSKNGVPGFDAVPGYDQTTGWGSFNGQVFIDNLK